MHSYLWIVRRIFHLYAIILLQSFDEYRCYCVLFVCLFFFAFKFSTSISLCQIQANSQYSLWHMLLFNVLFFYAKLISLSRQWKLPNWYLNHQICFHVWNWSNSSSKFVSFAWIKSSDICRCYVEQHFCCSQIAMVYAYIFFLRK